MTAILGGLGAAICFAGATLSSARATRLIAPPSLLAGVMLVSAAIAVPAAAASGVPDGLDARTLGWLGLAGIGNILGLLLTYTALRLGKVGLVAPVVSTEGAIAALLAIAAGEQIARATGAMLVVIACGILLAAVAPDDGAVGQTRDNRKALALAIPAAVCFGVSLYATGRVSTELPVAWALLPARALGVIALAVPLLLSRRLRITRQAAPLVLISGVCEVLGFTLFVIAARDDIAVGAVLTSQFAAIATLAAFVLFRERLSHVQLAGVTAICVGVAALSALQS